MPPFVIFVNVKESGMKFKVLGLFLKPHQVEGVRFLFRSLNVASSDTEIQVKFGTLELCSNFWNVQCLLKFSLLPISITFLKILLKILNMGVNLWLTCF